MTQVLLAGATGAQIGGLKGGLMAATGVLGRRLVGSMRAAGMQKVDNLVLEMLLDPTLAKAALMRAPAKSGTGAHLVVAHRLMRLVPFPAAAATDGAQR